jgi:hypothetical protein
MFDEPDVKTESEALSERPPSLTTDSTASTDTKLSLFERLRRYARDVVLIVTSILIAFSLDAWWDSQLQRRDEREALLALRSDFVATRDEYVTLERTHNNRLAAAEALRGLPSTGDSGLSADSLAALFGRAFTRGTSDPPVGALQSLLASGRLGLIQDDTLRAYLAG